MGAIIMELHSNWKKIFWLSCNWVVLNYNVYMVNCNFTIHVICPLTLTTYKYNELQVCFTIQKLNCKANCKTPIFFIVFVKQIIYHMVVVIALKKTHLWYDNYQTTWLVSYCDHMELQCLTDPTNFIKIKNNLNHFLKIFAFWINYDLYIYIFSQMYSTSHHMK